VLTVGIAVDSNVLIYERIREELRGGPHGHFRDRRRVSSVRCRRFSIPTSPPSSPPPCCSISAPDRLRGFAVTLGNWHHHHGFSPPSRLPALSSQAG